VLSGGEMIISHIRLYRCNGMAATGKVLRSSRGRDSDD
jgi:hypothetical protein